VSVVGVPTRGRPADLAICLAGHAAAARTAGRGHALVVVDDSPTPEDRAANRAAARDVGAAYAGPEERERYTAELARASGVPAELVRFALGNDEGCPIATGASRNLLLLHAVGDLLLMADDDTRARAISAPGTGGGLALTSRSDPTEFWFPEGLACADADLAGLHERLLGRPLGDAVVVAGRAGMDPADADAAFFRRAAGGRIVVTSLGVAGGAGMGSSVYLLGLGGRSRERLLASEATYRHAVTHRHVLRSSPRAAVTDAGFCMAANLGLDQRGLLPPFFPVQRNQDGVFGALVRACGAGLFGFLPWAVEHRPPPPPAPPAGDFWEWQARFRTGQLVQARVVSAAGPTPPADPAAGLRAVGATLEGLASLAPEDFEEAVYLHQCRAVSGWVTRLEHRLWKAGGRPEFWADDVKQLLAALRGTVAGGPPAVPADLSEAFGPGRACELFRRLVGQFGRLLQAWPALVEAARALREQGVRPAVDLRGQPS
jgi:hypothetical protein